VEFSNYVSVVTRTEDIGAILFDGRPVQTWTQVASWGYSHASFPVSHGVHFISVGPGSSACFCAYAYGHSNLASSNSGYGYTVAYDSEHRHHYSDPELSTGPCCVTRSNPTHQLTDPTQPNPLQVETFGTNATQPNPIQLTMELTI